MPKCVTFVDVGEIDTLCDDSAAVGLYADEMAGQLHGECLEMAWRDEAVSVSRRFTSQVVHSHIARLAKAC